MNRKIALILFAAVVFALPSVAQNSKLNGTWKLNNSKSTSSPTSLVVSKAPSTTSVSYSQNPSVAGQPVTFTATVTSSTIGTPTGTVVFKSGTVTIGSKSLSGGTASMTTSSLATGTNTITVSYDGSADFAASSHKLTQVVN